MQRQNALCGLLPVGAAEGSPVGSGVISMKGLVTFSSHGFSIWTLSEVHNSTAYDSEAQQSARIRDKNVTDVLIVALMSRFKDTFSADCFCLCSTSPDDECSLYTVGSA